MFPLTLERVIETLKEFTKANNADIEIILIGGLALHHYGLKDRATIDIDAEVKGNIEALFNFLKEPVAQIPFMLRQAQHERQKV